MPEPSLALNIELESSGAFVSDNNVKVLQIGSSHILYDAFLIDEPDNRLFSFNCEPGSEKNQKQAAGIGRAPVKFFQFQGLSLVLKHYYRGGLIARMISDWYLGGQLDKTRAYREWCLLRTMRNLDLPVPKPVAAQVIKKALFYQADLITVEIERSETLADYIMNKAISESLWQNIGRCLKRFHAHNIFHADLNARNILLQMPEGAKSDEFDVYLIDFDRGDIRPGGDAWKRENMARLKRSLEKFQRNYDGFNFDEKCWQCLLDGYV